jgi:hypothetical protein
LLQRPADGVYGVVERASSSSYTSGPAARHGADDGRTPHRDHRSVRDRRTRRSRRCRRADTRRRLSRGGSRSSRTLRRAIATGSHPASCTTRAAPSISSAPRSSGERTAGWGSRGKHLGGRNHVAVQTAAQHQICGPGREDRAQSDMRVRGRGTNQPRAPSRGHSCSRPRGCRSASSPA